MQKKTFVAVIFLVWITIFSGGCATKEIVTAPYPPLPLPERPVLPAISADEFMPVVKDDELLGYAISEGTAQNLFYRDKMRKQYELKLEAVIKSTHEQKND